MDYHWCRIGGILIFISLDSNNKYVFKQSSCDELSLVSNWRHFGVHLKSTVLDSNNKYVFKQSSYIDYH